MMTTTWEAPGPGQWALDRSHMPPGCTPLVQELMCSTAPVAMRRMFAELGAPVDTLSAAFVNGHLYTRIRPLISPDKPATRLPPVWVLRVATRLHPEMRRREKTAAAVLRDKPWNAVVHEWHHGGRALIEDGNLALQDIDLALLDDASLWQHVRDCWDNCVRNWQHHFWLHGFDLGPLGRYLLEAGQWGLQPGQLLALLQGASPSTSGPRREAAEIWRAAEATGATPATLDELRAVSPAVADAVDRYLSRRQWVLFSRYDVDGFAFGERPDMVLASIMASVDQDRAEQERAGELAARTDAARDLVPSESRAMFDELLADARAAMDLRDDNGPVTAEWPLGLLRRALLAIGDRLVTSGHVDDRTLALEVLPSELASTDLRGVAAAAELLARREHRADQRTFDPPLLLGPAELAPPLSALPPALAQLTGMVQTVVRQMGMDGTTLDSGLHGAGIGTTKITATARVASSPEDALDRLQPGEVLVVACTTPAYNLVLSLAGGVVTAAGGPMSHAAVLARELGIPAIVGASTALLDIPDGATVELDPVAGVVRVVSTARV